MASQLVACGPGFYAPERVVWYLKYRDGMWLAVDKRDFPAGDVKSGKPRAHGSRLLQSGAYLKEQVTRIVNDYGIPDAVRVNYTGKDSSVWYASKFELAYLDRGLVFEAKNRNPFELRPFRFPARLDDRQPGPAPRRDLELYGPPAPPYSRRTMNSQERTRIDPVLATRLSIDNWSRVLSVGRDIVLQVGDYADGFPSGYSYNVLTMPVTAFTAALFDDPTAQRGLFIVWVAPDSPAAEVVEVGWRVMSVNGEAPESFHPDDTGGEPVDLELARRNMTRTVRLESELWPIDVAFNVVEHSGQSAFVGRSENGSPKAYVGMATHVLDDLDNDDMVAAVLGHEVAHILLGHLEPRPVPERALRVGWRMTAGLLLPVVGNGVLNLIDRHREREADILGTELTFRAGYDPLAGIPMLNTLEKDKRSVSGGLALHPSYDERRRVIREEAARLQAEAEPPAR